MRVRRIVKMSCLGRLCVLSILGALAGEAAATVVPFTEDFVVDSANWRETTGTAGLDWVPAGGPDGSSYASGTFNFLNSIPDDPAVLFRGHDAFDSSNDAFVGNWIADGVSEFSFFFRHDALVPLGVFVRFASTGNFPAAAGVEFVPVPGNAWTEITIAIEPTNPQFVTFEGSDFATVFSSIENLQIGVFVPAGLAGVDQSFTFDVDQVTVVPSPPVAALLALSGLLHAKHRRRRRPPPNPDSQPPTAHPTSAP